VRRVKWTATVVLLVLAAGCGSTAPADDAAAPGSAGQPVTVVKPATLRPGEPVPVPAEKTLLTITGKVTAGNKGRSIVLDRAGLEQMGVVKVRVYEPWVKQEVDFRGVWLHDLLNVVGAGDDYSVLRFTALDDYRVDLKGADVRAGGVLLATSDGEGGDLPVERGGPTRIIFVGGVKAGANADQWIWSLRTIDVG
jgi:hypothetical protein